ncbi:MAG: hypothetical protein MJ252_17250 [archaeon]|nr:hypothetical protein [archaeon]
MKALQNILFCCFISFGLSLTFLSNEKNDLQTMRVWMGWVIRESGEFGFRDVHGDRGRAWGKYQLDYRYDLVDFMKDCRQYNPQRYAKFTKFIDMGTGSEELVNNTELQQIWTTYCDKYPIEFERLQDIRAYTDYYVEVRRYLKELYGINLDNHSTALRGTAWSMAIRSGPLNAAWRYEGFEDSSEDTAMMKQAYASYGDEDADRWKLAQQYGDALFALDNNEYNEVPIAMDSEDIILPKMIKTKTDIYIRSTPDSSSDDNIVGTYAEGVIVDVLYKTGNFYKNKDGNYFTSKSEYVEDTTGTCTVEIAATYSEPAENKSEVSYVKSGEVVSIYKRYNGYYYIRVKEGAFGWISSKKVSLN